MPRLRIEKLNYGESFGDFHNLSCYRVVGLPEDQKAHIEFKYDEWQYQWHRRNRPGDWKGHYGSADEALAALQRDIDGEPKTGD